MPPSPDAKPISIRKYSKVHEYPDSYDDVVKILRRLEKNGHVKCLPGASKWEPNCWALPGTKEVSPEFKAHELDITDLFKTFWRVQPSLYWDQRWQADELVEYGIHKKDSFLFDARMNFRGVWVFWEVNRGSKSPDQLRDQVKGYADFSKRYPEYRFHVIWTLNFDKAGLTVSDDRRKEVIARDARVLLSEFAEYRRGEQFLVARHHDVLKDPLGDHLVSSLDPTKPFSIEKLGPL